MKREKKKQVRVFFQLFTIIAAVIMVAIFIGCPASASPDPEPEIVYQDPVPLDSDVTVSSQLGAGGAASGSMSRALGDGGSLATPTKVTARGSDISFYVISGVDFEVAAVASSKVVVPLGADLDLDGNTDEELPEAFTWISGVPTQLSAPNPGSFQSTFYDMVVINLGQEIFKVDYDSQIYNTDEGYGSSGTAPFINNQVSETLDPKTNLEGGPSALGLTASNIILVDSSIINRIVYVPTTVFINVGLASSTKHSGFDGMVPSDAGVGALTASDYSYLTSNEILLIESMFKDEEAYDIFGFLLLPFDGIDLRVPEGETLPLDSEVEIILNWDITNCLELDPDDGNKPYFAKRASAGGDLPFDFDVDVIVR